MHVMIVRTICIFSISRRCRGLRFFRQPSPTEIRMDPPEPPSKRKRADIPETETLETAILDEPWFEDGNVILQAGNSRFKVYQGILSSRSPIFRDMFVLGSMDEAVDSCPVEHLSDTAQDVRNVLKAIFDRR